jgi:hypothetical protein
MSADTHFAHGRYLIVRQVLMGRLVVSGGQMNVIDTFQLFQLLDCPKAKRRSLLALECFGKKLNPVFCALKAHVDLMSRPLQLKDSGFSPLGKQAVSGIDEADKSHAD